MDLQKEDKQSQYNGCDGSILRGSLDEINISPANFPPSRPPRKKRSAPRPLICHTLQQPQQTQLQSPPVGTCLSQNKSINNGLCDVSTLSESLENYTIREPKSGSIDFCSFENQFNSMNSPEYKEQNVVLSTPLIPNCITLEQLVPKQETYFTSMHQNKEKATENVVTSMPFRQSTTSDINWQESLGALIDFSENDTVLNTLGKCSSDFLQKPILLSQERELHLIFSQTEDRKLQETYEVLHPNIPVTHRLEENSLILQVEEKENPLQMELKVKTEKSEKYTIPKCEEALISLSPKFTTIEYDLPNDITTAQSSCAAPSNDSILEVKPGTRHSSQLLSAKICQRLEETKGFCGIEEVNAFLTQECELEPWPISEHHMVKGTEQ